MSFITDLIPHAQKVGTEFNILPSLILAQACLESDYGKSGLAVQGLNLFGIKGSFNGQNIPMHTNEYINDKWIKVVASFRKYPSWYESLKDLADLYHAGVSWDRNKYKNIIGEKDINKACRYVHADGYATDPNYPSKLLNIVNQYKLTQFDNKPVTPAPVQPKPASNHSGYTGVSVVDYLKSVGIDSGFGNRSKLAASKGIRAYQGTPAQNSQLLKVLRGF
jgi:flagellum-specific peptidoglycan hydrolase FlgJ